MNLAELKSNLSDKTINNLIFDASHFKREFCLFLFRSGGLNIHYDIQDSETINHYQKALKEIIQKYKVLSFTIDGRKGVIHLLENLFNCAPIQLCQFHLVKNIVKQTTKRPKTECGIELKSLALSLKDSREEEFRTNFHNLKIKYTEFLKEKNERGEYSHKRLRTAFNTIKRQLPYLFTFEKFPHLKIEKTTNSCDGYFSHLKTKLNVHRGISIQRKIQMIIKLLSK